MRVGPLALSMLNELRNASEMLEACTFEIANWP